jgi:hypothetical protein
MRQAARIRCYHRQFEWDPESPQASDSQRSGRRARWRLASRAMVLTQNFERACTSFRDRRTIKGPAAPRFVWLRPPPPLESHDIEGLYTKMKRLNVG